MNAIASRLLGGITGCIGSLHQRADVKPAAVQGDKTNTCANTKTLVIVGKAEVLHALAQLRRDSPCLNDGTMLQDHAKLIAPESSKRVARSHDMLKDCGYLT